MKKLLMLMLSLLMIISLVACASDKNTDAPNKDTTIETNNNSNQTNDSTNKEQKNAITYSSMDEIQEIMDSNDGYVIIDVRTKEEYIEGHIPGAINIDNESILDEEPEELPDKNQLILIYCRSGNRSKQAAEKLANMGYTNIVEFGGIIDWDGDIVIGENPYNLLLKIRLPMPDVLTYRLRFPKLLGKH